MAITAADVKNLREQTGAGMMECKKALTESNGDFEKAIDFLRTKGLAAAQKKQSRIAAEGMIAIDVENGKAAMVEVNCETDFVAKNPNFQEFGNTVARLAVAREGAVSSEDKEVVDAITNLTVKLGEKISYRRNGFVKLAGKGIIGSYSHNGKIGVLVEIASDNDVADNAEVQEMAKHLAMHVCSAAPKFLKADDMDEAFVEHEKEIYKVQLIEQGKPEAMIPNILKGKVNKLASEVCLLDQKFVMDPDLSIKKYVDGVAKNVGAKLEVKSFQLLRLGEGIEKRQDDLAAEVAKMTK